MGEKGPALLKRAKALYEEGRYRDAEEILREGGEDPLSLGFRAYLVYREGRHEEAAAMYRRLSEIQPRDPSHLTSLGLICYKLNRTAEAREAFEKVVSLTPDDPRAQRNLGYCLRRLGDERGAEECFRRAGGTGGGPPGEERLQAPSEGGEGSGHGVSPPALRGFEGWLAESALPAPVRGGEVFRRGGGEVFVHIDEKVFLSLRCLFSYRGVIVFSPSSREARKAASRVGMKDGEIVRAEGTGEIGLSGGGRMMRLFHLGEGEVMVNLPSLVMFDAGVSIAYDFDRVIPRSFLSARLHGEGRLLIAVNGSPAVLKVEDNLPVCARAGSVVAWSPGLTWEREGGPVEGGLLAGRRGDDYLRFEGRGYLVIQGMSP